MSKTIPTTTGNMDTQVDRLMGAVLHMNTVCIVAKASIAVAGPDLLSLMNTAVNSKNEFAALIAEGITVTNIGPHVSARVLSIPDFNVVKDDMTALITTDVPALLAFYRENKTVINAELNEDTGRSDYGVLAADKQAELLILLDNVINRFV